VIFIVDLNQGHSDYESSTRSYRR